MHYSKIMVHGELNQGQELHALYQQTQTQYPISLINLSAGSCQGWPDRIISICKELIISLSLNHLSRFLDSEFLTIL